MADVLIIKLSFIALYIFAVNRLMTAALKSHLGNQR